MFIKSGYGATTGDQKGNSWPNIMQSDEAMPHSLIFI